MDFVNKLAGGNNNQNQNTATNQQQQSTGEEQKQEGGFLAGLGNKLNEAGGGGKESEKNEDYLDKGKPFPSSPLFSPREHHAFQFSLRNMIRPKISG